jgi:hypothetical protein
MSKFTPVAVIYDVDESELEKLKKEYGWRINLAASWSYNGEIVPADSFEEIDKMSNSEDYAYDKLMAANQRG